MYASVKRTIEYELIPFLFCALSLFAATVLIKHVILPGWQAGADVRAEVRNYRALISGDTEYDRLKNEIREKQRQLEQKHTVLTRGLADPQDLSGLLQMIFDKAYEADLRLDKAVPEKEERGKDYIRYPVLLEMTTTYARLGKFLASLENIPQVVRVGKVGIIAKNDKEIVAGVVITCFLHLEK